MAKGWIVLFGAIVACLAALPAAAAAEAGQENNGSPAGGAPAIPAIPAPSPAQAANPAAGDFENTPLVFPDNTRSPLRQGRRSVSTLSIFSVLFYVFLICAAFLFLMWLIKRYLPGHRQLFSHPALEVLGRTHLDQRRYLSLVRVGRRILVVGVTPDAISPLAEVGDGLEVAEIMELARPKNEAGKSVFAKLFQRHMVDAEQERDAARLDSQTEALADDIAALRGRIKSRREEGGGIDRIG